MRRALVPVAVALALITGCSGSSDDRTTVDAHASRASSSTPSAGPSDPASWQPATPSTSARPTEATSPSPAAEPSRPTTPAASTAGRLTGDVFPVVPGWRTVPGEGDEGRYLPNGTFVHAIDPDVAAGDIAAQRCTEPAAAPPQPVAALGASWRGQQGQPGTGLALEFATATDATSFWASYQQGVRTCTSPGGVFRATILRESPHLVDRRDFSDGNGRWVEFARLRDEVVVMVMLSEAGKPLTDAEALALAQTLFR